MPTLLIRYGELGLKSESVRSRFEQAMVQDIRRRHVLAKVPCVISSVRGRIFVESDDWRRSCEILSRTFGVVSFSPVTKTASDLETLKGAVVDFSSTLFFEGARFAVRARRTGNHPYTSQTLAEELGSALLSAHKDKHLKVGLDDPDSELFVEVREREAYLYSSVIPGPGGMPKGTQGKVLSLIGSERGVASSWLLMKRGCNVLIATEDERLAAQLEPWNPDLRVMAPEEDLFRQARWAKCSGLALEWDLAELEGRGAVKGDLPVFYPLVGMTQDEVGALLGRIRA
jgi:thiamine biosynthesis protein ThiI